MQKIIELTFTLDEIHELVQHLEDYFDNHTTMTPEEVNDNELLNKLYAAIAENE